MTIGPSLVAINYKILTFTSISTHS